MKHPVGDLVGEVTIVAYGLAQLAGEMLAYGVRNTPTGVSTRSRR